MSGATRAEGQAPTPIDAAWSDEHAVDVLFDLVATPSVSGNERAAVERFVMHARALGMEAEIDEAGSGIAVREERNHHRGTEDTEGSTGRIEIVLLGHIDTVAGEIAVRMEGEQTAESDTRVLHGRGSVDAKGPLAAMLVAAARATLPEGVTVRVCGAVGEETPHSRGARHIARTFRPDACIIGEPSGWEGVTLGYKGRLVVRIDVERACHHSAGPRESAPDVVCGAWQQVVQMVRETNEEGTHHRDTESTEKRGNGGEEPQRGGPRRAAAGYGEDIHFRTADGAKAGDGGAREAKRPGAFELIQCSLRSMESASDGLTERAAVVGGFRLPRWVGPEELQARIEAIAAGIEGVTLRFEGHERAHAVDRNDPMARALSGAVRAEGGSPRPKLKTGTADLNVVAPVWRCPIAAYGPGDSALDHTPIEHLPIAEYLRSIRVLTRAIETLAAELMATRWPASGGIGA